MNRIIFAIAFIIMVLVVGPFLNNLKQRELCPKGSSFIKGACCLDKNKNQVCDDIEPNLEKPNIMEIKEVTKTKPPTLITGSVVKPSNAKARIINSIILIKVLLLINILIYKKKEVSKWMKSIGLR